MRQSKDYIDRVIGFYDRFSSIYSLATLMERRPIKGSISFSGQKKEDLVLCVGCGTGYELGQFMKRGCIPFGIDISGGMLGISRKKGLMNICRGDAFTLPFKDSSFDLVYSSYVLDVFDSDDAGHMVDEMIRVARPGGKIVTLNNCYDTGLVSRALITCYEFLKDNAFSRMKTSPIDAASVLERKGLDDIRKKKVFWASEVVEGKKKNIIIS